MERTAADQVAIHVRVQDLSHQSQTWGTEIPVVRERDLRTGTLNLFDIPLLPAFRQILRVYDVAAREGAAVRVRFYRVDPSALSPSEVFLEFRPKPDKLLAERVVPLVTDGGSMRRRPISGTRNWEMSGACWSFKASTAFALRSRL